MMGLRAIRLCLKYQDIFLPQLRAILRASVYGNIKIMFPMISGIEELRQAKKVLDKAKKQLTDDGMPFNPNMEVGAMIEIPSAAMTADILAREVDFFSIGTNDLIQYSLAADRANEEISELFEPFHPAVLRFIQNVINAAHDNGIWVGLCGEMGGDPVFTMLLLGMGLDEFSMSPQVIPEIKRIIRAITLKEAQELTQEIMTLKTAWEIEHRVCEEAQKRFPELLDWGQ
jgi:phosphotransferase system enzyme I (PtsI)